MTPAFEALQKQLKRLPGVGYRSAERMAIYLLLERPDASRALAETLQQARDRVKACQSCGNICEEEQCGICANPKRHESGEVCVVEHVSDLLALEKAGAYRGLYHVLHGKLSPINDVGPEQLNLRSLLERARGGQVEELILALPNDIEGEATCHYITDQLSSSGLRVTRIGFGLPSGGSVLFADSVTLKSALEARKSY